MVRQFTPKNEQLFKKWPSFIYDGMLMQRFQSKITVVDQIKNDLNYVQTYTIQQDDVRPDIVARKFYGNPDYDWLILTLNTVIDPFFDWPMNEEKFFQFIQDKYKKPNQTGFEYANQNIYNYLQVREKADISTSLYDSLPIELKKYWTPKQNNQNTIISYNYNYQNFQLSPEGYNNLTVEEKLYWQSQSFYDMENEKNNNNKIILLVRRNFIPRIVSQHNKLINS